MRFFIFVIFFCFAACTSQKQAKYKEEVGPKFSTTRSLEDSPEKTRNAARIVLEEITEASNPPASGAVHEDQDAIRTGWVYGLSKDKYIVYNYNGAPRRKILQVRRKYSYTVDPSLSGSQVTVKVQEEIEQVDLKTGEHNGWKSVAPDQNEYDQLIRRIREKVRAI